MTGKSITNVDGGSKINVFAAESNINENLYE